MNQAHRRITVDTPDGCWVDSSHYCSLNEIGGHSAMKRAHEMAAERGKKIRILRTHVVNGGWEVVAQIVSEN